MLDFVRNKAYGSHRQPFYFSNFETFKVEKELVYPGVKYELANK